MDARNKLREERVQKPQKGNKRLYSVGEEAAAKAELELEMKAKESEAAGGCVQAGKPEAKADSIQVDLS